MIKDALKDLLKKSMEIPYDDISVYPTVNIAKNAIVKYCGEQGLDYKFLDSKEEGNIIVQIDGTIYEIYRGVVGRGYYGIKCRVL
ncbi:DUF4318 domain-containing protein [Bacillus massiliigorillae]|uniref:DUF4318 domain-containing protein n=1 Tax=Bacillus massiliigorillae TaxID=1243664 RepID=UPI00039F766C|nr:DUF4318 domain-containing protein [Bacillus massiliigorillae]